MWWTFAASLVASATALVVAFKAYPFQKAKDRELKISEEKRAAYQRFFDAAEAFFAKLRAAAFDPTAKLPDEEFGRLEAAKAELAFRAGRSGVDACAIFAQHLKDYRTNVKLSKASTTTAETKVARDKAYRNANAARINALLAARKDAGIETHDSASEDSVRKLFMMKASEEQIL